MNINWVVGAVGKAEVITIVIAVLALMLGALNTWRDHTLRKTLAAKERQAHVTISLDAKANQLVVANKGPAEANRVHVFIEGEPLEDHPWFQDNFEMGGPLGSGSEYRYNVSWEAETPTMVTTTWADGFGDNRLFDTTIPAAPSPPSAYAFD